MIGNAEGTVAQFRGLVELAKQAKRGGRPALEDPQVRQRLVEIEGYVLSHRYSSYRQLTLAARDQEPGPAGLMNKLVSTNLGQNMANLAFDLIGDAALVSPNAGNMMAGESLGGWVGQYMWSLGIAIAGGTANVQRNVIGERGLGLPRDAAAQRS
jgi:alkylation response protein AidB-like acyl-CoA dehydrogenase